MVGTGDAFIAGKCNGRDTETRVAKLDACMQRASSIAKWGVSNWSEGVKF